ncbi:MAG TPA: pseudouridine-5'-phosphate glycosidase [Chloroflexota bacterium]|nr:pseudouridine-5'-phosphate glycosidase [Chloroflexota bacterium]
MRRGTLQASPGPGRLGHFLLAPEVAAALESGAAIVALESTAIAHGLPWPDNLAVAQAMEAAVRAAGAVPATIAVLDGRVRVGLGAAELELIARDPDIAKLSWRDLPVAVARGGNGATTVAGTLAVAGRLGIRVFATGGLGGVHPGAEATFDVSADLGALARTPCLVVCSGAKSLLDLARTLELLESLGVPVLGYGTDELPAFYTRTSGLRLSARVDTPAEAATIAAAQWALGLGGGLVLAVPVPAAAALDAAEVAGVLHAAEARAAAAGVRGPALTPFLLADLHAHSGGRTLAANAALLEHNAAVGGAVAAALAALTTRADDDLP